MPKQKQVSEDVRRFVRQLHELEMRVLDGALDPVAIRQPLQAILTEQLEGQAVDVVVCPLCAATMSRIGKWYVCPSCGATTGVFRPDWYTSPEVQLHNMRCWNQERGWGFSNSDFPSSVPDFTPSSLLEVLVLAVYLPDQGHGEGRVPGYIRTARELTAVASAQQPGWYQTVRLDEQRLRLLPGTEARHTPGLRWVALDLGAHYEPQQGRAVKDVRGADSAHAEVLAAAAHLPDWLRAMDGARVPCADMAGYQYRRNTDGKADNDQLWTDALYLAFNGTVCEVRLGADWDAHVHDRYAAPCVRDIKS